jgi:hypothetical protein
VHPPPSPARANFTLITECTPESSGCNSVYSVPLPMGYREGEGEWGRTISLGGGDGGGGGGEGRSTFHKACISV